MRHRHAQRAKTKSIACLLLLSLIFLPHSNLAVKPVRAQEIHDWKPSENYDGLIEWQEEDFELPRAEQQTEQLDAYLRMFRAAVDVSQEESRAALPQIILQVEQTARGR